MSSKKDELIFITNIPSSYNLDLFQALSKLYNLSVYYCDISEKDRVWEINIDSPNYKSKVFSKDLLSKLCQIIHEKFYFKSEN